MKRLHVRRKALLRALRAAALAFLCWIGAQRAAIAQAVLGPGTYPGIDLASGDYALEGATYLSTSPTGFTGADTLASPYAVFHLGVGTLTLDRDSSISYQNTSASGQYVAALALGSGGNVTVDNFGVISAQANPNLQVIGVNFFSAGGSLDLTNSGAISADGTGTYAIQAVTSGSGTISISNLSSGSIKGSGSAYGFGIYANASGSGAVGITNSGTISGVSGGSNSTSGIYALSGGGQVAITNAAGGTIAATGPHGFISGIETHSSGSVRIENDGTIQVTDGSGSGNGIYGSGSGSASITNAGTIAVSSVSGFSYGVDLLTPGTLRNTGSISASSVSNDSYGIYLNVPGTIYNTGSITGGTAAILAPNGSSVTLAGTGAVNGLILGGTSGDHGAASTLDFDVAVRSNYTAIKAAFDATIAADLYAHQAVSVVINGVTYSFEYFGTVSDGLTPNAIYSQVSGYESMGARLDDLIPGANPNAISLLNALGNIPTANLASALSQLSPAKVSQQLTTQPIHQAIFQNMELGNRLTQVRQDFGGGMDTSGFQFAGADPLLSQVEGRLYAYAPPSAHGTVSDTPAPLSGGEQFQRWGTFLTGNAVLVNQSATASQNHVDSTTVDLTAGADYRLNQNWAAGFLFGYGKTAADVDELGSRVTDNQYRLGPYVGYNDGPWYADASGYFAFNDQESKRAIPLLGETARAIPFGTQYGTAADGGYEFKALDGKLAFGPTGGLQYTHLDIDSYTETGSVADLRIHDQHADSLISSLGGKADYDLHWKWNNATVRPDLHASWLHEFMENTRTVGAAFDVPGSASFTVSSERQQRDSALVGGGVQNIFPGGSLLYLSYDAQVGIDNYLAQSVTGGLKIVF